MSIARGPIGDRTPLPLQVYQRLRAEIASGSQPPGSRLPSEAELATAFAVSRVTVREALRMLQRDGLVIARHGRGHFVLGSGPIREPITELRGVTELLAARGYTVKTEVLGAVSGAAGELAVPLQVAADDGVIRVERLRSSGGEPLIYSLDAVPLRLLGDEQIDYAGSLVEALAARGYELAYSHARISAAELPRHIVRRVVAAVRLPWLLLDQVNYSSDGTPLIVSQDYHRGDRFEFDVIRRRIG
jgi:GntR family transcriptional regulator